MPSPRRATDAQLGARGYDANRAVDIFSELAGRAFGTAASSAEALKTELISLLAPFGEPAFNLDDNTLEALNERCCALERCNPTPASDAVAALDGAWSVRYSDAPPPSNGALGPLRGKAYQVIDAEARTYSNELELFGGALELKLAASFEQRSPRESALRVAFRSITLSLFGLGLPPIQFPQGTERTWLLTYSDRDTRLVRAGVDGGRSTARELGLIAKEAGEAADSYLFVLTRVDRKPPPLSLPQRLSAVLAAPSRRLALKAQLLGLCSEVDGGSRLGAGTDAAGVQRIELLMNALAELNPTEAPASSARLCGSWEIIWTTESELLALTANGFLGLPCQSAYQTITRERQDGSPPSPPSSPSGVSYAYTLQNSIDFDGGFLRVDSSCEPSASGGRVDFRFESCTARWRALELPLPPVGSGWFDVLYLDDDLRLCKDVRGDLQICRRRRSS
jgi:hypothetical protein